MTEIAVRDASSVSPHTFFAAGGNRAVVHSCRPVLPATHLINLLHSSPLARVQPQDWSWFKWRSSEIWGTQIVCCSGRSGRPCLEGRRSPCPPHVPHITAITAVAVALLPRHLLLMRDLPHLA